MVYFRHIIKFFHCLFTSSTKHNIVTLAAVIAFFGFSAMIPLMFLVVYGTSVFIPHNTIQQFLFDVLESYVPTLPDTKLYLIQNISRLVRKGSAVGIFGLVGLLWTSIGGFVSFQQILDIIWGTHRRRSFAKQYLVGFGMLGILMVLTIISSLGSIILPALIEGLFINITVISWLAIVHNIFRVSFPLLLFLTCFFCYRFLPSHTIKNAYLLLGSMVSTLGIYLSRAAFVWYSSNLGQYEMVYGSLTFIMLFTFWVYIVSVIVLFGAEVAVALNAVLEPETNPNF